MTEAACISSTGVVRVGAPARWATSASPVQSVTRSARIASRPGFLDEPVSDHLEALGVDLPGQGLGVRYRGAHALRALLELPPDTPRLDGRLMPVPGQALDPHHGEVAAEAPEPLQKGDLGAGPGRRDRRGQAAGPAADDEHRDTMHDVDRTRGLADGKGCVIGHPHQCRRRYAALAAALCA